MLFAIFFTADFTNHDKTNNEKYIEITVLDIENSAENKIIPR